MDDLFSIVCTSLSILVTVHLARWWLDPLSHIPNVGGPATPLLSWLSAIKFQRHGKSFLQQGLQKYRGSAFRVVTLSEWLVVFSGQAAIHDVKALSSSGHLSFPAVAKTLFQTDYTLGVGMLDDPWHFNLALGKLTQHLARFFPAIMDELVHAVQDNIPAGDSWVSVNASTSMRTVVARVSSRVYVGLPACRNDEYVGLAARFAGDVAKDALALNFFPSFVRPFARFFVIRAAPMTLKRAAKHIQPLIDLRRRANERFEDDKCNDMLQWVMEEAARRNLPDEEVIRRTLSINIPAIQTSHKTATHALYDLAYYSQYIQPLRDEIEPIVSEEGWTKVAVTKMVKLDSFVKESQRTNGPSLLSYNRRALKDVTFSDGTFVPEGTALAVALHPTHFDEDQYPEPNTFDPFRFSRAREEGQRDPNVQNFSTTSPEWLAFGHGKFACPGRFFASSAIKTILAYIIVNYDLKLEGDGSRPANVHVGATISPAPDGRVLFKKRKGIIS